MSCKSLKRYKFTIEYCGTKFLGWQRQSFGQTVQGELEQAASALCGHAISFSVAGRTDAGVHALGQVAHADIPPVFQDPCKALFFGLNHTLVRKRIAVLKVESVDDAFHARFSARKRTYLYRILDRSAPTALDSDRVWFVRSRLNEQSIQNAMKVLEGEHCFKAFQSSGCSSPTSTRHMISAYAERSMHSGELHCTFSANGFLYHQVRNMVGALVQVGSGRMTVDAFQTLFVAGSASVRTRVAPASGLYLLSVGY